MKRNKIFFGLSFLLTGLIIGAAFTARLNMFQTAQREKVKMTVSVEKFEELRRQVAYLLRYTQQIECIRYLNI